MSTLTHPPLKPSRKAPPANIPPQKTRRDWTRLFKGEFLLFSILVHLLFGIGAAYYVVQTITAKPKLAFKGGPPAPHPNQRAVEHKVQLEKKKASLNTPVQARRIVTNGLSKVSLPNAPLTPTLSSPSAIQGVEGGKFTGVTSPGTMGTGGAGGASVPFFGFTSRPKNFGALKGTLYDLKQLKNRTPSKIDVPKFDEEVIKYAKSGFNESGVSKYFCSTKPIYITQFFIPRIKSEEGPQAFGLGNVVKPNLWIVHYEGKVSPPQSGTYYFVGEGDDFMLVKFQGRLVLDSCWVKTNLLQPTATYNFSSPQFPLPFKRGLAIHVEAGKYYDIEIVIGDQGGLTNAALLIEQNGINYQKDAKGNPILPPFRLAPSKLPPPGKGQIPLPVAEEGPVWKATSDEPPSALDLMRSKSAGDAQ